MRSRETLLATLLLVGAVAFNLATLWPEVAVPVPTLNDDTLHLALVGRAVEALERGEDPTDPWVPYFVQGYPLFHHYQHLPHLATALLFKGLLGAVPLRTLYDGLRYLLLSTFPLSIYWAGRRLGIRPPPAALAGVLSSLLATNGLYGLDMASYVWGGYGLYTQLWGMWLLPPAVAGLYVTLKHGRAYAGTALLLAATLLSHTVLGYVALLSGAILLFLPGRQGLGRRIARLGLVLLLVALLSAYFLVPFFLDRLYMNRSVWEDPGKYDAYGWQWTLTALWRGELLDYGRFPVLTLLAALGLVVGLFRWRDERYRLAVVFFLFWLLFYFGRPTWGVLLEILPLSGDLHLHRLIAPVHLGAIALAGAGLAWLAERVLAGRKLWPVAVAGVLGGLLLSPAYAERLSYLEWNAHLRYEQAAAVQADGGSLAALLAHLRRLPPGRVYAGRGAGWGADYRLGSVPVYALLSQEGFDSPGYLYHALSLNADIEGYLDESRPATFDLFNLRYVIAPAGQPAPSFARPVADYGSHRLYTVPTSGYFGLVDSDLVLYGRREEWFAAARTWLQSDLVERRQHPAIVFGPAPATAPALPLSLAPTLLLSQPFPVHEPCGQVLAEQVEGNRYSAEFQTERACWLLLKETFHPGWQATLDGRPAAIQMLAPSFVGVRVEPGRHRAVLTYEPGPLRPALGLVGLAVLLLAAAAEWQRARWWGRFERLLASFGRALGPLSQRWARLSAAIGTAWEREGRWLALLLGVVLLAGLPTLQLKQMMGHDALEYLPRAAEFYRNLQEGELLPRWAPDLSMGYGQPFFLFNPPLVYYLTSAFHALGVSLVAALNLTCLLLLALAGLGMYVLAREFFGPAGGVAAGSAYVLSPVTLVNLYVRYALADYAAMAWIPWALWGLYRWVASPGGGAVAPKRGGAGHLSVAAAAIALLLLSSNPVALVAVPVLAAYALFLALGHLTTKAQRHQGNGERTALRQHPLAVPSWFSHPFLRALGRAAWALGLGLGLAAFFWLPALAERHWVQVSNLLVGYLNYGNHFVYLHQLVYSPWGYGLSLPGPQDKMSFGLGIVQWIALLVALALAWRRRALWRDEAGAAYAHLWFFVGVLALVVFLVTDNSIFLWDALPLLQYLEFPWRILVLAAAALAFVCAFPFLVARTPGARRWLLGALLGGLLLAGMPHARPEGFHAVSDADYTPERIAAQGIEVTTTGEYEPIWAAQRPEIPAPESRLLLVSGEVRIQESRVAGTRYEWLLEAAGPAHLRVATHYFPGWRMTVDGRPRLLTVQNPYGLMDFVLEGGVHRVEVSFGPTPLRSWAGWISLGALVLLGATALLVRRR